MKRFWVLLVVSVSVMLGAAEYDISNIKLTLGNKKFRMAYDELKMHLELTGNKLAPGAGALEIIIGRAGEKGKLAPGESRWLYRNGKLYIWGNEKKQYPGTLFAVYCLLEEKFGVRWLYPGDEGIVVPPRKVVSFKENESFKRVPEYIWGWCRWGQWSGYHLVSNIVPESWRITPELQKKLDAEHHKFILRHRHGRIMPLRYGHAFTKWPDRFEKSHPEYFGVGPYGKPMIPPKRNTAKLCLSNPAVIEQIIADWKAAGMKKYLCISPNDGTAGYCLCAKCMALDTRKAGEGFYAHLTDRYLNFWNRVAKRAVKERPDVMVTTYVYSYYRFPPRREKIEYPDNMLCGLVPALAEDSGALFEAWKKAGMKHCFIRPNDTHPASAQIRGMEKRIFDKYQSSRKSFKLYGADYDSTLGVKARDLEHYIICRMIAAPEKSFDELMDEFCSGYGAAAATVKEFYATLRSAGEKMYLNSAAGKRNRMVLDDSEIVTESDRDYEYALSAGLRKLAAFPKNKLTAQENDRINRLTASVMESLLVSAFCREGDKALAGKDNNFAAAARDLWYYRDSRIAKIPDNYPAIVRRSEKRYWDMYQPYRSAAGNDGVQLSDPGAGWRNSFDEPSTQGWKPRKAFKGITLKEASFDRYSIEVKPVEKAEIVLHKSRIPVTPGAKYDISFDVKAPAGANFRLRIVVSGKTFANIKTSVKGGYWKMAKGTFTVPAGVKELTMYICASDAPEGGFIDNVVLERVGR